MEKMADGELKKAYDQERALIASEANLLIKEIETNTDAKKNEIYKGVESK